MADGDGDAAGLSPDQAPQRYQAAALPGRHVGQFRRHAVGKDSQPGIGLQQVIPHGFRPVWIVAELVALERAGKSGTDRLQRRARQHQVEAASALPETEIDHDGRIGRPVDGDELRYVQQLFQLEAARRDRLHRGFQSGEQSFA